MLLQQRSDTFVVKDMGTRSNTASAGPNSYVLVEEQGDDIRDKERLADRDRKQADTAIRDARLFRPTRCARLIFASTAARAWRFSA